MPKKQHTLDALFINKLSVLLDIETQLVNALPKMAQNATNPDLKMAFEEHLEETKNQVERVKACLIELGEKPKPLESEAIRGLVKDAQWVIKNVQPGPALDANLIAAAQYVEHYEMAGYGTAAEWARLTGHDGAEQMLREILDEEKAADAKLNDLAINKINDQVADEKGMQ